MEDENEIQNKQDKKCEWTKRITNEIVQTETEASITEQDKVVRKLREVLDFFENVQISNAESLENIRKPLDELLSSLKYLPVEQGPCFNDLPTEIKMEILGNSKYTCESGAFVAATVCQDWKSILQRRLVDLGGCICICKCCLTDYGYGPSCEDGIYAGTCFMPEEKLKASIALGKEMDISLAIGYPITDIDSKLVVDGLMSVSDLRILDSDCFCKDGDEGPILSRRQTEDLFEAIENKTELNSIHITGLDMTHLDQDKLMDCLFKIKSLTLSGKNNGMGGLYPIPILDFELFVEKLAQASINSPGFKLSSLYLSWIRYPQSLSVYLAKALCNVESVEIGPAFSLRSTTAKQMIQNVLKGGIRMKSLYISEQAVKFDWNSLITSDDLRMLTFHMVQFRLAGRFSQEQMNAVRWLPGVELQHALEFSTISFRSQ